MKRDASGATNSRARAAHAGAQAKPRKAADRAGDQPRRLADGSSAGEALGTFCDDILAEARRALERDDIADTIVVHDFRKAMKRWRAFLRLIEPAVGLEARGLRTEARDIARAMAAARDLQAALDALDDIERRSSGRPHFATARKRLEERRVGAEGEALSPELRARAAAAVQRAAATVAAWRWRDIGFAELADGLTLAYRRARNAIPRDWAEASDEELHDLRQRVVVHRYQMQFVEPLWPRFGKLWTGEAQRLRDRLGARQDLTVLRRLTAPRELLAPWRARLEPLIAERQAAHTAAAAKLAHRLFAERPRAFARRSQALWEARRDDADEG